MRDLAARIGDRPGRLLLSKDMQGVAWGKLLFNLNNAINALSGETYLERAEAARFPPGLRRRDHRDTGAAEEGRDPRPPRSARSAPTCCRT